MDHRVGKILGGMDTGADIAAAHAGGLRERIHPRRPRGQHRHRQRGGLLHWPAVARRRLCGDRYLLLVADAKPDCGLHTGSSAVCGCVFGLRVGVQHGRAGRCRSLCAQAWSSLPLREHQPRSGGHARRALLRLRGGTVPDGHTHGAAERESQQVYKTTCQQVYEPTSEHVDRDGSHCTDSGGCERDRQLSVPACRPYGGETLHAVEAHQGDAEEDRRAGALPRIPGRRVPVGLQAPAERDQGDAQPVQGIQQQHRLRVLQPQQLREPRGAAEPTAASGWGGFLYSRPRYR